MALSIVANRRRNKRLVAEQALALCEAVVALLESLDRTLMALLRSFLRCVALPAHQALIYNLHRHGKPITGI